MTEEDSLFPTIFLEIGMVAFRIISTRFSLDSEQIEEVKTFFGNLEKKRLEGNSLPYYYTDLKETFILKKLREYGVEDQDEKLIGAIQGLLVWLFRVSSVETEIKEGGPGTGKRWAEEFQRILAILIGQDISQN